MPPNTLPTDTPLRTPLSLLFLTFSALAAYEMRYKTTKLGLGDMMLSTISDGVFKDHDNLPLRQHYTGIAAIDQGLQFLSVAFMSGAGGWDKEIQMQQAYFLVSFMPIVAVQCVEAGRAGGGVMGVVKFTTLWILLYQTVGGAIILPLYFLASLRATANPTYWVPSSRRLPLPYAKALLPAVLIGYLLPTILIYLPYASHHTTQAFVALWQPAPLFLNILLSVLPPLLGSEASQPAPKTTETTAPKTTPPEDVPYIKSLFRTILLITSLSHLALLFYTLNPTFSSYPHPSLTYTLLPRHGQLAEQKMDNLMHYVFQIDYWYIFLPAVVWAWVQVYELRRVGKETGVGMGVAGLGVVVGSLVVGPGAVVAGVWGWREGVWGL